MNRQRFLRVALPAVLAVLAAAPALPASAKVLAARRAPAEGVPQIAHETYRLPNGLQVILAPDRRVPLVAVDVWYHVGSGNELVGRSGFAHLFEHMMFQGSKHTGEDQHFAILRKIGASQVNGTTNPDRTNYYEVVPSHHLETALWLESDRMGWLLDLLSQKSLDNQREVVRNERRQNYDNVAHGKERFALSELLYGEGHPYRHLTIGLHEDLERASLEDVRAFFQQWYVPSNATLCLAGDFDPAEAKALVAKWFGSLPKMPVPSRKAVAPTPVQSGPKRQEIADPFAKLRRVHYAWHSPKSYAPGDAELDLLAHVLGHGGTGRLYKRLVHEKQLAQSVSAYQQSQGFSSIFHVVVDLRPGADQAEAEKIVAEELARIRSEPVTDKERQRAVVDIESQFVWGLEGLLQRAEVLQGYNHFLGAPGKLGWDLDRYRNATVQGMRDVAAKVLLDGARVEVVTQPQGPQADAGKPQPTSQTKPQPTTQHAAQTGGAR